MRHFQGNAEKQKSIIMDNYLNTLIQHKFNEDLLSAKAGNKDESDVTWSQKT